MGFISRYRHGRGFGVHSPFAFRLICEVLNEKGAYYDYALLNNKGQKVLYRLGSRFNPGRIAAIGNADLTPLAMACRKAVITDPANADFIVTDGTSPLTPELTGAIDRNVPIYICGHHKQLMKEIRTYMKEKGCGMTFDNGHAKAFVAPFSKLPRQDFSVRF